MAEIRIKVDNEGNIEAEVNGVKGKGCEKLLEGLLRGGKVKEEKLKSEYYQTEERIVQKF